MYACRIRYASVWEASKCWLISCFGLRLQIRPVRKLRWSIWRINRILCWKSSIKGGERELWLVARPVCNERLSFVFRGKVPSLGRRWHTSLKRKAPLGEGIQSALTADKTEKLFWIYRMIVLWSSPDSLRNKFKTASEIGAGKRIVVQQCRFLGQKSALQCNKCGFLR